MTSVERTCTRCGLVFSSEKLEGLCPSCLFTSAFDASEGDTGTAFWDHERGTANTPERRFSHFELIRELGRGGMGVVYQAHDLTTDRMVALKLLQAHHLDSPDLVQRFRSEVRAVSSLDHPNVLPIHEVGEHEGIPFFSMKLASGGSLAEKIGDFLGKPREVARLVAKIARGVQHAHERGILHRDLKPGNVLLDTAGEPYVCDFGLAKWIDDDRRLTVTAAVLGTPHYIAPEQASGEKSLTIAVDIYSLGAILYELLTGRPPFAGATLLETLRQASQTTPDRPSMIAQNVPGDLETICLKCIDRVPTARYLTAGMLADDLEAWLDGRPIRARPVSAAEQLWRWARRNPLPAILAASIVLLLGVAAVGSTLAALRIDQARKDATEQLYQSLLAEARAARLTGTAGQRFESLEAIRRAARIHPRRELRTEAVAALSLFDLKVLNHWKIRDNAVKQPFRFTENLDSLCVATLEGNIDLFSTSTHRVLRQLRGNGRSIYALAYSGDRYLAARTEGDEILVWDIHLSDPILRLQHHALASRGTRWVYDFAFSRDQSQFAVSKGADTINIFALSQLSAPPKEIHTSFETHILEYSPDGKTLLVASMQELRMELWDVSQTPRLVKSVSTPAVPQAVAWRPNSDQIAIGSRDYNIYLLSATTGEVAVVLRGHRQDVTQLLFSADGALLASTARDMTVRLWDPDAPAEQVSASKLGAESALCFSSDGRTLGCSDYNNEAYLLEAAGAERTAICMAPAFSADFATLFSSLAWSPSGRFLALSSFSGISVFDTKRHALVVKMALDKGIEKSIRFLDHDDLLLIASRASAPAIYKIEQENDQWRITRQKDLLDEGGYILANPSADHSTMVGLTSLTPGKALVIDRDTRRTVVEISDQPYVWDIAYPPSLAWVATAYSGNGATNVLIWSPSKREPLHSLDAGAPGALAISPDGESLVTTGATGYVWDTHRWEITQRLNSDLIGSDIRSPTFSPDGQLFAVSTADNIVLLNARDWSELAILDTRVLMSEHYRVRFSPDSRYLAAQGADNSLRIWDLAYAIQQLRGLQIGW